MKKSFFTKERLLSKAENLLDVSGGVLRDLPNITIYGTENAEIDNFKALLDFSPDSVRINTTGGIIRIDGLNLAIGFMTDDTIAIKGSIKNISFE